jgi:cytochrome c oxidase subunit 4
MSTITTDDVSPEVPAGAVHGHPSDMQYVKIALILAFITALEVGTYFIEEASTTLLVIVLAPMMIVKFVTVAAYFMHLKYDKPIFRRVFTFGLVLAVVVFGIMLTTFQFWTTDYLRFLHR